MDGRKKRPRRRQHPRQTRPPLPSLRSLFLAWSACNFARSDARLRARVASLHRDPCRTALAGPTLPGLRAANARRGAVPGATGGVLAPLPSPRAPWPSLPAFERKPIDAVSSRFAAFVLQVWPLPEATAGGMSGENSRHRAKVYCLNDDGQWDDRGTGQAFIQYIPVSTATLPSHRSCCHNFLPRKHRPHASGSCSRGLCLRHRALCVACARGV